MARTVGALRLEDHRRAGPDRRRRLGSDLGGAVMPRASTMPSLSCLLEAARPTLRFASPMLPNIDRAVVCNVPCATGRPTRNFSSSASRRSSPINSILNEYPPRPQAPAQPKPGLPPLGRTQPPGAPQSAAPVAPHDRVRALRSRSAAAVGNPRRAAFPARHLRQQRRPENGAPKAQALIEAEAPTGARHDSDGGELQPRLSRLFQQSYRRLHAGGRRRHPPLPRRGRPYRPRDHRRVRRECRKTAVPQALTLPEVRIFFYPRNPMLV